ncbi:MAG: 50S ribosomal protein L10 [Candidatus Delongbacteria bacterium]|jgi:large subunit ribosomal protein L10|nr:50S ribosomal protein L10 [Candidatus Delongbacteria bacterium]MDD4204737.1 50S ribosomal protein L10 [Candidatus Delongbacteria bacterium]MDY0016339.1 50S ribosomal protein L10 [Candidatus Delongbacteria bacterium]
MTEGTITKQQTIEKQAVIDEIRKKLESSSAFYVTKYDGINVEKISKLRRDLRSSNSEMKVFKNTLVVKALQGSQYLSDFENILKGPNSITFAYDDPASPAKILFAFAKQNAAMEIKGCLFENQFYGADKMSVIKDLPTRDALLSMLANVINEPMSKVARIVDALRLSRENS